MDKKWWKSKIFWTMIAAIVATAGGIITGEVEASVGIPALVTEVVTAIFRLFFTNTNLTT
jgi:hypothetical protein